MTTDINPFYHFWFIELLFPYLTRTSKLTMRFINKKIKSKINHMCEKYSTHFTLYNDNILTPIKKYYLCKNIETINKYYKINDTYVNCATEKYTYNDSTGEFNKFTIGDPHMGNTTSIIEELYNRKRYVEVVDFLNSYIVDYNYINMYTSQLFIHPEKWHQLTQYLDIVFHENKIMVKILKKLIHDCNVFERNRIDLIDRILARYGENINFTMVSISDNSLDIFYNLCDDKWITCADYKYHFMKKLLRYKNIRNQIKNDIVTYICIALVNMYFDMILLLLTKIKIDDTTKSHLNIILNQKLEMYKKYGVLNRNIYCLKNIINHLAKN
jgi:hypothetical protein